MTPFEFLYLRNDDVHVISAEHHRAEPDVNVPATIDILEVDHAEPPAWAEAEHEAMCEVAFAFLEELAREAQAEQDAAEESRRINQLEQA